MSARSTASALAGGVWWPRLASVLVWGLAGYATLYWGLRLTREADGPVRAPLAVSAPDIDTQAVARALGAGGSAPAAAPVVDVNVRYVLVGVLAGAATPDGHGVALIAVEGQKPRPFAVGSVVDGQWVVQRVTARGVTLQPQGASAADGAGLTLSMPDPQSPAR
ncbi:MAG TPA: type II secretion system protein N [Burkholderiaceae bacterium]|nr:type II secretion system protein N [Burkholderiaceae bacterium]